MGYSIIFETKIIKLKDNRVLHLCLSGCNNDNAGRSRDEFYGTIYTTEDFDRKIEGYKADGAPFQKSAGWDLKIGTRCATYYDYGMHLERMQKRAMTWEELQAKVTDVYAIRARNVSVFRNNNASEEIMSADTFETFVRDNANKLTFSYRFNVDTLRKEEDIVAALDAQESLTFFVGRTKKS